MIINYKEYGKCKVEIGRYGNHQKAIQLIGTEGEYNGSVITVPTVSMDICIEDNEVIIKDYSENEGAYSILLAEGVISKAKRKVQIGYGTGCVCELLVDE